MGGFGMRARDLRDFMTVARRWNVILLVRHTNDASLRYVGRPGFCPKPAVVKAKTADVDPPPATARAGGVRPPGGYAVAGLVVHPGFQPLSLLPHKRGKAQANWDATMQSLGPRLIGRRVDLLDPADWQVWGKGGYIAWAEGADDTPGRENVRSWHWRVDVDPASPRFGCLQLRRDSGPWCCVHGDYDLKDVIVPGAETVNERREGTRDGVKNYTPKLPRGLEWPAIRDALNREVGVEMVQHGAEAQFAWHGDEPVTVIYPDWRHETLGNAVTVQTWYDRLGRAVLASTGIDYRRDPRRMLFAGPDGLLRVEQLPPGFQLSLL